MIPDVNVLTIAAKPTNSDDKSPKTVASQVQAMFMEIMIRAMEDSVGAEDGLFGGSATSDIYRSLYREHLAASLGAHLGGRLEEELEEDMAPDQETERPHETTVVAGADPLPVSGVVTSGVGWRSDPFSGATKFHKGTDIAAAAGTSIQAVAGGVVVESGLKGTYGNAVVVETDDGRRMLYAHNQQNFVRVGDRVVRGDAIAAVGATGRATGPHVHFEVMK